MSAVSGPFRIVAKQVTGRPLLDYGVTFHEIQLDVHWEPRYPVFRIDTNPKIKAAKDDKGNTYSPTQQPHAIIRPEHFPT